jgi:hypothetical protein
MTWKNREILTEHWSVFHQKSVTISKALMGMMIIRGLAVPDLNLAN